MERIVPIYENTETPSKTKQVRGTLADLLICILAALSGLSALGYACLFFIRFLENDTHFWGVLSAFVLCFGVGAFAYIPAAFMSFIGWRAHKRGRITRDLIWALGLTLPWLLLSIIMVIVSDLQKIYSLPILAVVVLFVAWTVISLRHKA